jgi:hypothetical protein
MPLPAAGVAHEGSNGPGRVAAVPALGDAAAVRGAQHGA